MGSPSQSYRASPAVWDHTVLPATRHRLTRPALTLGWYSIYLHRRDGRLSWPRWLVTYWDGLAARRQSPKVLTRPGVEYLLWLDETSYRYTIQPTKNANPIQIWQIISHLYLPIIGSIELTVWLQFAIARFAWGVKPINLPFPNGQALSSTTISQWTTHAYMQHVICQAI